MLPTALAARLGAPSPAPSRRAEAGAGTVVGVEALSRGRAASGNEASGSARMMRGDRQAAAALFRQKPLLSGPESASASALGFVLPERSPPEAELFSMFARQDVILGSLSIVATLPQLLAQGRWHRAVWAQFFDSVYESACAANGEPSDICSIAAGFFQIENDIERAERLYEVAVQQEQEREQRRMKELSSRGHASAGAGGGGGGAGSKQPQCASAAALAAYAHFLFLTEGRDTGGWR